MAQFKGKLQNNSEAFLHTYLNTVIPSNGALRSGESLSSLGLHRKSGLVLKNVRNSSSNTAFR